jgi:hypothetical protein
MLLLMAPLWIVNNATWMMRLATKRELEWREALVIGSW